ncbi:MAG TPA: hypothetical protein VNL71_01915 [Chloroflexota bacterium]|nr:hypothetical protein [Chloroflexota bacterium]
MSEQSCTLYVRQEATYIFPQASVRDGQHVLSGPVVRVERRSPPTQVGGAIAQVLATPGHPCQCAGSIGWTP